MSQKSLEITASALEVLEDMEDYGVKLLNMELSAEKCDAFLELFHARSKLFAELSVLELAVKTERDGERVFSPKTVDVSAAELIRCILEQNEALRLRFVSYSEYIQEQIHRSDEAVKLARLYYDYALATVKLDNSGHRIDKSL